MLTTVQNELNSKFLKLNPNIEILEYMEPNEISGFFGGQDFEITGTWKWDLEEIIKESRLGNSCLFDPVRIYSQVLKKSMESISITNSNAVDLHSDFFKILFPIIFYGKELAEHIGNTLFLLKKERESSLSIQFKSETNSQKIKNCRSLISTIQNESLLCRLVILDIYASASNFYSLKNSIQSIIYKISPIKKGEVINTLRYSEIFSRFLHQAINK